MATLVERLRRLARIRSNPRRLSLLEEAAYRIEALEEAIARSGWIPCSERLPEAVYPVLAAIDDEVIIAMYSVTHWEIPGPWAPDQASPDWRRTDEVTHWQELPKLPIPLVERAGVADK